MSLNAYSETLCNAFVCQGKGNETEIDGAKGRTMLNSYDNAKKKLQLCKFFLVLSKKIGYRRLEET